MQMASVKKFAESAVVNMLRHNERAIANPTNEDIDPTRSIENYSLIDRGVSAYDYYKERKSELYCYNRADVKTLAGWIVTAPTDLPLNEYDSFFRSVHDFLCSRYGERNCVQSIVHADESGQPHLHWLFIPTTIDLKHGGEKICANEVINRKDLRNFHSDLQNHITNNGIHGTVKTGITKAQGGNRTVKEMKRERQISLETSKRDLKQSRWRTQENVREYERERW